MIYRKNLCPKELYGIKCPFLRTPDRIVVHNTGNDASAQNEIAYMLRRKEEISFHIAVDDEEAVQGLPFERNAWASGDGRGPGNMLGIHIEICYSLSGGERFMKAERNAAKLIAGLLKSYGWGIESVTKHQDYDGKRCPHRTLDLGWDRFLEMIKTEMEAIDLTKEDVVKIIEEYLADRGELPASPWAEEAIEACKGAGVLLGDESGEFHPQALLTRQELAVALSKILKICKFETLDP